MDPVVAAAVGGVVTAVIGAVAAAVVNVGKATAEAKRTGRADALAEWSEIHDRDLAEIARVSAECDALRRLVEDLQRENAELKVLNQRTLGRIELLEDRLARHGDPVRPFNPSGPPSGTDLAHKPLPPTEDRA